MLQMLKQDIVRFFFFFKVLKRPRKFRIAQICKITQTVQLALASLQTPFSLSELAYIVIAEILVVANNPNHGARR